MNRAERIAAAQSVCDYYFLRYSDKTEQYHPSLGPITVNYVLREIDRWKILYDHWKAMIDAYFDADDKKDWHILHFVTGNAIESLKARG